MAGPGGAPEDGVGVWGQLVAAEKDWGQILSPAAATFSPTALLSHQKQQQVNDTLHLFFTVFSVPRAFPWKPQGFCLRYSETPRWLHPPPVGTWRDGQVSKMWLRSVLCFSPAASLKDKWAALVGLGSPVSSTKTQPDSTMLTCDWVPWA